MNWYKISQEQNVDTAVLEETDTGFIDFPPIDDDNENSGWGEEQPSWEMRSKMMEWAKTDNAQEAKRIVIETLFQQEPQHKIFVKTGNKDPEDPLDYIKGEVTLRIEHNLKETDSSWNMMVMALKPIFLKSNVWKYIGIHYNEGFKYLNNHYFVEALVDAVFRFVKESNEGCFYMYQNHSLYEEEIKTTIIKKLKETYPNLDISTLSIIEGQTKPLCTMTFYSGPEEWLNSTAFQHNIFTIRPWAFETNDNSVFEKMSSDMQRGIIADIINGIEYHIEEGDIFDDLDIEVSMTKGYPGTREEPPEPPEVDKVTINPEQITFILVPEQLENTQEISYTIPDVKPIFESIPNNILKLFKNKVEYPVVIDTEFYGETENVGATVEMQMLIEKLEFVDEGLKIYAKLDYYDIDF